MFFLCRASSTFWLSVVLFLARPSLLLYLKGSSSVTLPEFWGQALTGPFKPVADLSSCSAL